MGLVLAEARARHSNLVGGRYEQYSTKGLCQEGAGPTHITSATPIPHVIAPTTSVIIAPDRLLNWWGRA